MSRFEFILRDFNFKQSSKAGFDPNQVRNPDGTWGAGGWNKIDVEKQTKTHYDSYNKAENDYGSTYDPMTGKNWLGQENKYSVGIYLDRSFRPKGGPGVNLKPVYLSEFLEKNKDLFDDENNSYGLGTWYNKSEGGLFVDIVKIVDGFDAAKNLALENDQIGIYDLGNKKYIDIGGSGGVKYIVMEGEKTHTTYGKKAKEEGEKMTWAKYMQRLHTEKRTIK